jgi:CMP-N,N'-diacetyllegionaminic acid synthase
MKILGVIPARGGSKGIPQKNIKLLNGRPLISYTIEAALKSELDKVIVSTDCMEIAGISEELGASVILRDQRLAQDDTPTLAVLQSLISTIGTEYDAVMTLQPTSPLRNFEHINQALDIFIKDGSADSLVSVVRVPHNCLPEKIMYFDGQYLKGNNKPKRRQLAEHVYARNGAAIYITKIALLDESIFGGNVLPYVMNKLVSFDIDDTEDWEIIERFLSV